MPRLTAFYPVLGKLQALKVFKDDVDTVETHHECGLTFDGLDTVKEVRQGASTGQWVESGEER